VGKFCIRIFTRMSGTRFFANLDLDPIHRFLDEHRMSGALASPND
jgi:hypothetical protein